MDDPNRKQDLEDEMNRFEQEIAGNLPPPPKSVVSTPVLPPPSHPPPILPRPPVMGVRPLPFPSLPPMPIFGHRTMMPMDRIPPMPSMPTMPGFTPGMPNALDRMPGLHPMQPSMPMMGIAPPMIGMVPPPPGQMPPTSSQLVRIDPPTVPLKNYEPVQVEEIKVDANTESVDGDMSSSTANGEPSKDGKGKKIKKKSVVRVAGGVVWEDDTLMDWDNNDFRIFVGDLGNEVSDDALLRAFSAYSSLLKAKVVRDKKTKKTKGYGFVSFKDPKDYLKAMREMNGKYVGNRPIKLRKSSWKDRNINVARKKEKEKKKLGLR